MIDFFEVQAAADQKDLDNGWYWAERGKGGFNGPFASKAEAKDDSLAHVVGEVGAIIKRALAAAPRPRRVP